jgi:hypothetical protein
LGGFRGGLQWALFFSAEGLRVNSFCARILHCFERLLPRFNAAWRGGVKIGKMAVFFIPQAWRFAGLQRSV